ncbi:MAG TPA: hypothetical protein VMV13_04265 [Candidatus Binataceae bacterium]|nr:hypothetical protein [Candidatus Binataceae bacterium]
MAQQRIKSGFIYLANAVNDLRGNWINLAVVLAPLIVLASMCLLPEALNLQHHFASSSGGGGTTVGYFLAQEPYHPPTNASAAPAPYPEWLIYAMRGMGALISLVAGLVVLVELKRIQTGERASGIIGETIAVYASAGRLALAYLWIAILQLLAPGAAILVLELSLGTDYAVLSVFIFVARMALLVGAGIVYLWLYFAEYALVFDGERSFHSLLFSRDLMRKRFFTVASRVVVFLAVWSGYNSWAVVAFYEVSLLLGPVAQLTGVVSTIVILLNLMWLSISLATSAFFIAAGVRMYQDLIAIARAGTGDQPNSSATLQATVPLSGATA